MLFTPGVKWVVATN